MAATLNAPERQLRHAASSDSNGTLAQSDGVVSEKKVEEPIEAIEKPEVDESTGIKASEFPEGGLQGWLTLTGASLVMFVTSAYTFSFGVYQDFYVRVFLTNYTPSEIGWIGSIQIFFLFTMGIISGRAFDRGYFHHMMIFGMVLQTFSHFMLSLAHQNSYYQVFLCHLGGAIAHGIVYVPAFSVIAHYFNRLRPLAMGVVAAGVAGGGVVHTILLNHVLNGPIGFANGVRISQGVNTALFLIANLIMRTRLKPKPSAGEFPLIPFMKDPPYFFLTVGTGVMLQGLFTPFFYLQLYALKTGLSESIAFYSLGVLNGVSVLGRTLPTLIVPKVGTFNLGLTSQAMCGVVALCMPLIHNTGGLMVYAAVYGFVSGITITLQYPMFANLSKDIGELGARIGVGFFVVGFFGVASTPLNGAVLTEDFDWWHVSIFSGVTLLAASMLTLISRTILARRKGKQII